MDEEYSEGELLGAIAAGVDVENEEALNLYMLQQNLRTIQAQQGTLPAARTGPKVGRNAPCPCGSSKKYKKCCGR